MIKIKAIIILTLCLSLVLAKEDDKIVNIKTKVEQVDLEIGQTALLQIKNEHEASYLSINIYCEDSSALDITSNDFNSILANSNSYINLSELQKNKESFTIAVKNNSKDKIIFFASAALLFQAKSQLTENPETTVVKGEMLNKLYIVYTLKFSSFYLDTKRDDSNIKYTFVYSSINSNQNLISSAYEYLSKYKNLEVMELKKRDSILLKHGLFKGGLIVAESQETGEIVLYKSSGPFAFCSYENINQIIDVKSSKDNIFCFPYSVGQSLILNYWTDFKIIPASLQGVTARIYLLKDNQSPIDNSSFNYQINGKKTLPIYFDSQTEGIIVIMFYDLPDDIDDFLHFNFLYNQKENKIRLRQEREFVYFCNDATSIMNIYPLQNINQSTNIILSTYSESNLVKEVQLFTIDLKGKQTQVEIKKQGNNYKFDYVGKNIFVKILSRLPKESEMSQIRFTFRPEYQLYNSVYAYYESDMIYFFDFAENIKFTLIVSLSSNLKNIKYDYKSRINIDDFENLNNSAENNLINLSNRPSSMNLLISGNPKINNSFLINFSELNKNYLDLLLEETTLNSSIIATPFYLINKQSDYFKNLYLYSLDTDTNICISKDAPVLSFNPSNCVSTYKTNGQLFQLNISQNDLFDNKDLFVTFYLVKKKMNVKLYKSYDQYESLSSTGLISFVNISSNQSKIIKIKQPANNQIIVTRVNDFGSSNVTYNTSYIDTFDLSNEPSSFTTDYVVFNSQTRDSFIILKINAGNDGYVGRIYVSEPALNIDSSANHFVIYQLKSDPLEINADFTSGSNYWTFRSIGHDLKISSNTLKLESIKEFSSMKFQANNSREVITISTKDTSSTPVFLLIETFRSDSILSSIKPNISKNLKNKTLEAFYSIPGTEEFTSNTIELSLKAESNFTKFTYLILSPLNYTADSSFYFYSKNTKDIFISESIKANKVLLTVSSQASELYVVFFAETSTETSLTLTSNSQTSSKSVVTSFTDIEFKDTSSTYLNLKLEDTDIFGVISAYKRSMEDKCVIESNGKYGYLDDQHDAHIIINSLRSIVNVRCSNQKSLIKIKKYSSAQIYLKDSDINQSDTKIKILNKTEKDLKSSEIALYPQIEFMKDVTDAKVTYYVFAYEKTINQKLDVFHFFENKDKLYLATDNRKTCKIQGHNSVNVFVVAYDTVSELAYKYDVVLAKNYDDSKDFSESKIIETQGSNDWKYALIAVGAVLFLIVVVIVVIHIRKRAALNHEINLLR